MSAPIRARRGCLICKARKVRCDKPLGKCTPCIKMRLTCPGINTGTSNNNANSAPDGNELSSIVDKAFGQAGRRRRAVGACQACRISKIRCTRGKPCQQCADKGLSCDYSTGGRNGTERRKNEAGKSDTEKKEEGKSPSQDHELDGKVNFDLAQSPLQSDRHIRSLCEAYFLHIHPLRCLSFIHKPSFMQSLDSGRVVDDFGEGLICIVCAFGERFSFLSSDKESRQNGVDWAERAQELAFSNLGRPSVSNLMNLVLLCEWHIRFGQESTAFMIAGIASRLAQLLRLDSEPTEESLDGIPSSLVTAEKESRRRLVWSCYIQDVAISSGVDLISNWSSVPKARLPCSAREFTLQLDVETGILCEGDGFLHGLSKPAMCLEAFFVRIIYLRKQVLRIIRKDTPDALAEFDQLVSYLEACDSSLPRHLQLNEINAYVHEENNQLAAFYALHLLHNQCFCDLYRVTLPGYRFPMSEIIAQRQSERVESLQTRCVQRAQKITSILRGALNRGATAFTDSVCSICAYESAKIQVIHSRTCSEGMGDSVVESIGTNLKALNIIFKWDKKRDALLSSLSKLLHEFGFSNLAMDWLDQNGASFTSRPSEDATPESHHLHPLALYRMTWKEISWPQKPDANARIPRAIQLEARNQSVDDSTHAAALSGPAGLENAFNLNEQADTVEMTDIDSYLQMADDFSNYLTWDPWNFGYA